jgi:hypothetical protein
VTDCRGAGAREGFRGKGARGRNRATFARVEGREPFLLKRAWRRIRGFLRSHSLKKSRLLSDAWEDHGQCVAPVDDDRLPANHGGIGRAQEGHNPGHILRRHEPSHGCA